MSRLSKTLAALSYKITGPAERFVALNILFFLLLVFLRIYEFVVIGNAHAIPGNAFHLFFLATWYDFVLHLVFACVLVIPFVGLSLLKPLLAKVFYAVCTLLAIVGELALLQYFAVTFTPLGSDLFGYSWNDIKLTLSSSGGFSLFTIVPFMVFGALVLGVIVVASRTKIPRIATVVYYVLMILSLALAGNVLPRPGDFKLESEFNVASNKLGYFAAKTFTYLLSTDAEDGGEPLQEYPLLHEAAYPDVLGSFFNVGSTKPNLVFIIVEGLGRSFIGDQAPLGGFTPFLDSLSRQSLYWENFLSTSGRTFAVLPSLFGSLPYGEKGFMEMGDRMPSHLSLIRLLKEQGYFTSYYHGSSANFDLQDVFLERQQIDLLVDEYQFGPNYSKAESNAEGFSWGYADGDLFKRSLELIGETEKDPRLDIYLTISTHEPFIPPNKEFYHKEFAECLRRLSPDPQKEILYKKYQPVFESLLYVDDALRFLFTEYRRRPDYDHTIFIITGDHRIIPIPAETKLDRFHVPFIMFSAMVKQPRRFSSVSTHADVTPSILAFLEEKYGLATPKKAHWLGTGIDTASGFRNVHTMALKRNKEELLDFLDGDYFLAGDQLFRLHSGMRLEEVQNDSMQSTLVKKFAEFKRVNRYVNQRGKLYPDPAGEMLGVAAAKDDSAFTALIPPGLNSDQLFQSARDRAFAGKYDEARLICRKLLRNSPNFHDVRTLLGRTYAWEKRFGEARATFEEVIRRAPMYSDAYAALADVEFWAGNSDQALGVVLGALQRFPANQDILLREAKILAATNKEREALIALDKLLRLNPTNDEALVLHKKLRPQ